MKHLFLLTLFFSFSLASLAQINSFKADFTQNITDEKNTTLSYDGNIRALKPQNALWVYSKPFIKYVYISSRAITIIEPEIEQVIIKKIDSKLDFFNMIKNAQKIGNNIYEANYAGSKFNIKTENKVLKSISYVDEFENSVEIIFMNQEQNILIDEKIFIPLIPLEYDIIND